MDKTLTKLKENTSKRMTIDPSRNNFEDKENSKSVATTRNLLKHTSSMVRTRETQRVLKEDNWMDDDLDSEQTQLKLSKKLSQYRSPKLNKVQSVMDSEPKTKKSEKYSCNKTIALKAKKAISGVKHTGFSNQLHDDDSKSTQSKRKTMRSGDRAPKFKPYKLESTKTRGQSKTSINSQKLESANAGTLNKLRATECEYFKSDTISGKLTD